MVLSFEHRNSGFNSNFMSRILHIKEKMAFYAIYLCLLIFVSALSPQNISAAGTSDAFFEAETCYSSLRKSAKKMKYRENWLHCIKKFQGVYRRDPSGPWAPASLYMSGVMYQELAYRSGSKSDKTEALDIFERVVKKFPNSQYRAKAAGKLRSVRTAGKQKAKPAQPKKKTLPAAVKNKPPSAKNKYIRAESCYLGLRQHPQKQKYRHNWQRCIDKSQSVYKDDPQGPWAAAGLYMTANLFNGLYRWSKNPNDLIQASAAYQQILDEFPQSRYRIKAKNKLSSLPAAKAPPVTVQKQDPQKNKPKSTITEPAISTTPLKPKSLAAAAAGHVTVKDLRFWSNPNYTRIVIDADRETNFSHHLLKKDPVRRKPPRLYIDLTNSRLGDQIKSSIPIHDDLLTDARAGQFTSDSVRVVVDIKSFETYKIFSLKDPFRIVVDVWGTKGSSPLKTPPPAVATGKSKKVPAGALAKQLALGVRRIVVDPGHGGKDFGAPGYLKGVHEKKIVLQIAQRLTKKLKKELKCEVILTRNNDRYLTLEERTAFANTKNADLFISIHTNASRDRRAYGVETYFLNLATDDEAIRVAAMENATSTKNISDLETILSDLMQNSKINESSRLASHVQLELVKNLKGNGYVKIRDKGVKQAPFYVLLGAQMPAILVETSFISNSRECKRLKSAKYQDRLCEGIVWGVKEYIKETTPYAFARPTPSKGSGG